MVCSESAIQGHATTIGGRRRQRQRWATIRFPLRKRGSRSPGAVNFVAPLLCGIALVMLLIVETSDHRLGRGTCCLLTGVAALTTAQRRAIVLSKIRNGMLLSQEAKHNVTAAEEACRVWESILSRPSVVSSSSSIITQDVLSLSKTLYASCLVRVGRDLEAISVYDSCLTDYDSHQKEDIAATGSSSRDGIKWRLAKARCLQRLLKYSDAAEEFSRVVADAERKDNNSAVSESKEEQEQARMGAATCILRSTGDVASARKILGEVSTSTRAESTSESRAIPFVPSDALLLASCLEYLETGNDDLAVNRLQEVLDDDALDASKIKGTPTTSFLLYRWILATLKRNHRHHKKQPGTEDESASPQAGKEKTIASLSTTLDPNDLFMELIRINTSPLDDPDLLRLDDKIELHNLLTTTVKGRSRIAGELSPSPLTSYWPDGLVLPAQSTEWKGTVGRHRDDDADSSSLWIAKSRAGYGSHGNRILTLAEANEEINGSIADDETNNPARKEKQIQIQTETEPYLLQRMIDPLMLLNGYKFSLRIYVVYFSSDEAYISSKGLVKLASEPLLLVDDGDDDESSNNDNGKSKSATSKNHRTADPSMHMTNSGRETVMQQEDLEYLWSAMGSSSAEKEELWKDICRASAETLLLRYPERIASFDRTELDSQLEVDSDRVLVRERKRAYKTWKDVCREAAETLIASFDRTKLDSQLEVDSDRVLVRERKRAWKTRREQWGIPKILGLDFVVQQQDVANSTKKQPWLVEVNRFPGLEPRDEDDRKIKYRIVRDAWLKASERHATSRTMVPTKDGDDKGGSGGDCDMNNDSGEDRHALLLDGTLFELLSCGERDGAESSLERLQLETQ